MEAIQQIIARHGYRGLYTGVGLHAVRDTIGTGLYFGIYETAKQLISTFLGDNQSPFGAPMAAGALSGVIPWICVSLLAYPCTSYHLTKFSLLPRRTLLIPVKPAPRASS
jgi:hypothetical protein